MRAIAPLAPDDATLKHEVLSSQSRLAAAKLKTATYFTHAT